MLAHGPEGGAGFEHVVAEVLHEAVVVLHVEEEVEGAAGEIVPADGVEVLDDGGTLGADGIVAADGGGNGAVGLEAVAGNVEVEQAGLHHLLQARLGHGEGGGGGELRAPEGAALLVTLRRNHAR